MKIPIKIGEKSYTFKKEALLYYKNILNSYKFGESLNDDDYNDMIDLINYDYSFNLVDNELSDTNTEEDVEEEVTIEDIKIAKVQYGAKCFEIMYSDKTSEYISYIMMINRHIISTDATFNIVCRNSVQKDLKDVKKKYFRDNAVNGLVKCQETNQLSKWEDLAVDHRQPNTFSVIVDRFKEVLKIDINKINYQLNEENFLVFEDETWAEKFRIYHKEKANLRIVRKECNLSRTGLARLKRSKKDLTVF